ncbi:MAG: tape measure protein [Cyanobacteria bacterium P01_H01_bin.105]
MATTIGSLVAELGMDLSKFTVGLNKSYREGLKTVKKLEKEFSSITLPALKDLELTAVVDDQALTDLNKHYDLKEQHAQRLQRNFDANPLTPRVDTSELDKLKATGSLGSAQISTGSTGVPNDPKEVVSALKDISSTTNDIFQAVKGVPNLPQAIASQSQPSAVSKVGSAVGNVLSVPGEIVSNAVGSIATGALENVGREATSDFSKGLSSGINRELSFLIGSFDKVGNQLGQGLIKGVLDSFGRDADMITKVLEAAIGKQTILVEGAAVRGKQSAEARSNRRFARSQSAAEFEFVKSNRGEVSKLAKQLDTESKELARKESVIRDRIAETENKLGMKDVSQALEIAQSDYGTIQAELQDQLKRQEQAQEDIDTFQARASTASNPATRKDAQARLALAEGTLAESTDMISVLQAQGTLVSSNIEMLTNRVEMISKVAAERFQGLVNELIHADDLLANQQRRFQRYVDTVETFDLLDVPADIKTASPVVNRARKKDSPEAQQISRNYQIIVEEVAKRSGVALSANDIPRLVANERLGELGLDAGYHQGNNAVHAPPSLIEALNKGTLDSEQLELLIHELRHAIQADFGRAVNSIAVPTLELTPDEQKRYGPSIENSVRQSTRGDENYRRVIESDANAFAGRESAGIGEALARQQAIDSLQRETGVGGGKIKHAFAQMEQRYADKLLVIQGKFDIDSSPEAAKAVQAFALVEQRVNDLANSAANLDGLSIEEISKLQSRLSSTLEKAEAVLKNQVERFESTVQDKAVLGQPLQMPLNPLREPELVEVARSQAPKQQEFKRAVAQTGVSQSSRPIENVSQQIEDVVEDVKERLTFQDIEALLDELNQVASGFKTKYAELKKQIKENVKAGQEQIARAQIEAYLKTSEESRAEIEQAIEVLRSEGVDVGLETPLGSRFQGLKGQLSQKETFAKRQLTKLPEATSVGGNISEGMAQGVEPQAVVDAIENMAEAGIKAAEDALEIQSPSKVFERIGRFVMQGFNLGMSKAPSNVSQELEAEIKAAQKAAKEFSNNKQIKNSESVVEQSLANADIASAKFDKAESNIEQRLIKSQSDLDNTLIQLEAQDESLVGRISRILKADENLNQTLNKGANLLKGALGAVVGFQIGSFLLDFGQQLGAVSLQAATDFEKLGTSLSFVLGSATETADAIKELRAEANDLGIDAGSSIRGFQQIAASTRDTTLEGVATEQIATAANQAVSVFQLNPQEGEQVTRALSQISSKGVVSTEEIRQQMGEVLPSAFQTAARAMNVTTSELDRMLARGEVLSDEFLPRFAQQLSAETAAGVAGASKTAQAALNRLNNQIEELRIAFGDQLLPVRKLGADILANALDKLVEIFPTLINLVVTVSGVMGARMLKSTGLASRGVELFTASLARVSVAAKGLTFAKAIAGLKGMIGTLAVATKAMVVFGLQMLAIQAAIAAVRLAWEFFGDSSGDLGDFAEASTRGVDNLIAKLQQLQEETGKTNEALNGMGNRSQRDQLNSVKVQGFAGELLDNDLIQRISDISGRVNPLDRLSRVIPGIGKEGMMGVYQRTFAADQLSDQSARIAEMGAERERLSGIAASYLEGGANADRTDEYIRVQQQLKAIQQQESALRILDPADVEALEKVTATKDELLSRQGPLVEEIEGVRAAVNAEIQTINNAMSSLEESLKTGAISPEKFAVGMADYEAQLADAVADQEAFNDALDGTASRLSELNLEFEMIAARIADASQAANRSVMGDRRRLLQAQLAGSASSGQVAFTAGLIDQKRLKEELRILEDELSNIEIQLETPDTRRLIENLRARNPEIDQMGTNQLNVIRERFAENPEYQQAIDRLAEAQNVRLQTEELSVQIAEARLEANQQIRDANREITAYYREVSNQANELALQTREVASQADFADIKNKLKSAMTGMSGSFFDDWIGGFMNFLDSLQEIIQIQVDADRQREQALQQQMQAQMQTQQMQRGLPGQVPGVLGANAANFALDSGVASRVVAEAERWDGQNFREGVFAQCAFFVREVFENAGINLGVSADRNSSGDPRAGQLGEGMAASFFGNDLGTVGFASDPTQIPSGAVVGFTNTYGNFEEGAITHVGVSTGGGQMVDRSTRSRPVQERAISTFSPNNQGQYIYMIPKQMMGSMPQAQMPVAPSTTGLTVKGQAATQEQIGLAQRIYQVGSNLGANNQEIRAAIATAIQESVLTNLNNGDKDSLGIFQQRPSMEWGTRAQIANPDFAIESFFLGRGSNRGMIENRDRAEGDVYQQSHFTQASAHPDAPRQWDSEAAALLRVVSGGGQSVGVNTGQFNQVQGLQNQNFTMDLDLIERRAAIAVEQANLEANNLFKQLMGTANRESMAVEDRRTGIDRELQDRTIQSIPQGDLQSRTQEAVSVARSAADSSTQYQRDIQQLTADIESANEALATMEQARDVLAGQLDTPDLSQQLANYDALIERTRTLRDEREDLLSDTQEAFNGALDFKFDSMMADFERQAEDANIAAGNVDPIEAQTADLRRQITALEDHMETASSTYRESIEGLYPKEQVDELVEAFNLPNQIKLDGAVREVERLEESLLAAQEAARIEIRTESLAELTRILNRSGQGNQAQELNFQNQRDQLDAEENQQISDIKGKDLDPEERERQIGEVRTMFDRRRENLAFDQEMSAGDRDRTMRQQSLDARQSLQGARQQQADMLGFGGIAPLRQESMNLALEQQQIDYEAQIAELYATTDAVGRTTEAFAEMEAAIERTNELNIDNIKTQFSDLPEIVGAIKAPMTDALEGWISGTQSFGEAFDNMLSSILSNLLSMVANQAVEGLLGSLLGGMGGSGAGQTGGIAEAGGLLGGIGSLFAGLFRDGGKVGQDGLLIPNFSLGGQLHGKDPIKDALKREGAGARLIVANRSEWVLNRKHQAILREYGVNEKVLGFKDGGVVGGGASSGASVKMPNSTTNVSAPFSVNVTTSDSDVDGVELAARIADPVKSIISQEIQKMQRPNGQLRRRQGR